MVHTNTIILLILLNTYISHLTSQTLESQQPIFRKLLCDLLEKSNKSVFDYAGVYSPRDSFMLVINCDVCATEVMKYYEFVIIYMGKWNDTTRTYSGPKDIIMWVHFRDNHTRDTLLIFHTKNINRCEFKANAKNQFECERQYQQKFSVNPFGCPDQRIDMRSVIAYYPYSYYSSNVTSDSVLFVGRTQRTIMISDWNMSWTDQTSPVCHQIKDTNTNSIIPKFLFDIEKNLEITGILGTIDKETNKPLALILFYDSGQHKYCVTEENQLNISCRTKNLKTYMNCSHQYVNTTDSTESQSESTTNALPSNKPKSIWIVIAIIAVVLLIIAIIIGIVFSIYSVYSTNSDSTDRSQPQTSESSDQKRRIKR